MDRVHQNKPYQLSSPQLDPRVDICYTTLKYIIAAQSRAGSFKKNNNNWCTAASSTAICLCKERASYCRQHMPLDRVSLNVFVLSQLVHHISMPLMRDAWVYGWERLEIWKDPPVYMPSIFRSYVSPYVARKGPYMLQPHHIHTYMHACACMHTYRVTSIIITCSVYAYRCMHGRLTLFVSNRACATFPVSTYSYSLHCPKKKILPPSYLVI